MREAVVSKLTRNAEKEKGGRRCRRTKERRREIVSSCFIHRLLAPSTEGDTIDFYNFNLDTFANIVSKAKAQGGGVRTFNHV